MKSMIFCMIVAFCASIAGIGGTVILKDGKTLTDVTLEGITTDMIRVSGKEIPRDTVKKLETRKFDVPAKPMWIVLADGTVLNGLLGKFSPEKVTFYSVICGALEIPVEKVAVLITAGTMPTVPPKGIESPTVLQQAGRLPGCTRTAHSFLGTARDARGSHRCSRSMKTIRLGGYRFQTCKRSDFPHHKRSHRIRNLRYSTMTFHGGAGKSRVSKESGR